MDPFIGVKYSKTIINITFFYFLSKNFCYKFYNMEHSSSSTYNLMKSNKIMSYWKIAHNVRVKIKLEHVHSWVSVQHEHVHLANRSEQIWSRDLITRQQNREAC